MLTHIYQPPHTAKQKILLTAHDLFYSQGIRATGIDKIIANAEVTKTTFYRHFSSKNNLIIEFLDYRHQLWMTWFIDCLQSEGDLCQGLTLAMEQWFSQSNFRGCAFVNSLAEISAELPEALNQIKQHKQQVTDAIEQRLLDYDIIDKKQTAQTITMTMDGAIVRAQSGEDLNETIALLNKAVRALLPKLGQ